MKTLVPILILLLLIFHCKNDKKRNVIKSEKRLDTIVVKKDLTVEQSNSYPIQNKKEIEYFVSVNKRKSNLKYIFSERNDGKVVISRNYDFPNLPTQKSVFEFDELKYILKEAKNDFKIDSLNYLIYGTLDTAKNLNYVKVITKKYIQFKNGKSNISTNDYWKISDLILQSEIVNEINSDLSKYSKSITKINIEKAHFYKSDVDSSEIINCFVVMSTE